MTWEEEMVLLRSIHQDVKKERNMKRQPQKGALETVTISFTLSIDKLQKATAGLKGRKILEHVHEALHELGIVAHTGPASDFIKGIKDVTEAKTKTKKRKTKGESV